MGIVEQFKYVLRVTAHPQILALSCERPQALARDNTVSDDLLLPHNKLCVRIRSVCLARITMTFEKEGKAYELR